MRDDTVEYGNAAVRGTWADVARNLAESLDALPSDTEWVEPPRLIEGPRMDAFSQRPKGWYGVAKKRTDAQRIALLEKVVADLKLKVFERRYEGYR